jgi:hypothetical protein
MEFSLKYINQILQGTKSTIALKFSSLLSMALRSQDLELQL